MSGYGVIVKWYEIGNPKRTLEKGEVETEDVGSKEGGVDRD